MKVAIVHDYIKEYGGAERVLEAIHEIWPDAPVFTTVYLPRFLGPHKKRFSGWDIRTSILQNIPFVHKLISPIRIVAPWVFENWDFSDFDVVIVSATGAYTPNLILRREDTLHVCFCHTPPRYLYGYPTARNWRKHLLGRVIGTVVNHLLRQIDFLSYQRPDAIIANSHEVKRRIAKFYRREAEVIYPPVGIRNYELGIKTDELKKKKREYYLAGGRLARPKHIDLAIRVCNELKLPLKVFGRPFADYGEELKQLAGPTVEFVGEVSDEELADLYRGAAALLYPAELEDFGIMPVEAQGYGIPVVAYRSGGVKETVVEGKTGVFFDELTVESMKKAIKLLSSSTSLRASNQAIKLLRNVPFSPEACRENAKRFSKDRFQREIKTFVHTLKQHQ